MGTHDFNLITVGKRKLPTEVYNACINRGLNVAQMNEMSGRRLFEEYLEWEGIIRYANRLYSVVGELEAWDEAKGETRKEAPASQG